MNQLIFFVSVSFICFISGNFIEPTTTVPAFLWSNKDILKTQNFQISKLVPIEDLQNILQGSSTGSISQYFSQTIPEVIFVFVEPQLSTESFFEIAGSRDVETTGGQFVHLKELIETSTSSLVLPYVNMVNSLSFASALNKQNVLSIEEFQMALTNSKWECLNNGVTDIFVIYLDNSNYSVHDALFASLEENIKSNYLSIFTSISIPFSKFEKSFPILAKQQQTNLRNLGINYWSDGFVTALFVMIPFLIILFFGVFCTF